MSLPLTLISEISGSLWDLISYRNITRRGSHHRRGFLLRRGFLHSRGFLTSIVRYERQGLAGSSSSFGEEVTRHRASGGSMLRVSSSVWGLLCTQPRGGSGAPSDWMLLFCWRTRFCLGQWAMRWASLVLRYVVFCSSLDHFQQICWDHFLLHCGGGFTSSGNVRLQLVL